MMWVPGGIMFRNYEIVDELQPELEAIESEVTDAYRTGTNPKEERVTGHLAGLLASRLEGSFEAGTNTIEVEADAYGALDEPTTGVDLGLRYQIYSEEFAIATGVLIQAKRFGSSDIELPTQCRKMFIRSQEAYVFAYAPDKIHVFPALPIFLTGATGGKFTKFYGQGFVPFMCRFFEGYHGDLELAGTLDEPASALPVAERIRYLVDIRARINLEEANFDRVHLGEYRHLNAQDFRPG
jgi:hypothetical protein